MSSPLDEDRWSNLPHALAFAAPEILRTVLGQREAFAASSDQRAGLHSVLDDAVEMRMLAVRDVQRITVYLDSHAGRGGIARRYYREAVADREASHLAAILFGVAAAVASPGAMARTGSLSESDLATFIAGTMALGPVISAGVLIGITAQRQDVRADRTARS